MKKETCNKCGNEVIEDKKLDNNVWNCPNCGLEEYSSVADKDSGGDDKYLKIEGGNYGMENKYFQNIMNRTSEDLNNDLYVTKGKIEYLEDEIIEGSIHYPAIKLTSSVEGKEVESYLTWYRGVYFQVSANRKGVRDRGHGPRRELYATRRLMSNDSFEVILNFYKLSVLEAIINHNTCGWNVSTVIDNWHSQEVQNIVDKFIVDTMLYEEII